MDFSLPERGLHYLEQLQAFFDAHILPRNREWHLAVKGNGELDPPFLAELQAEARRQGLWNMAVPDLLDDDPGTRLSHLEYAPLAELMGRVVWSSRVFNCQPPDVPNVFALQAYTTPAQREQWLQPLLEAECRSGFAMTEPDVASSDATNIATHPAGKFSGPVVVSMRPFTAEHAKQAAEITAHYPIGHGAPIHQGDPDTIGISDLESPDYGMPVKMTDDQIPVFWACGVTPQEAILRAKPELAITHAPGHMFVSDITSESTRV
mgnify:CR=1 FL=1